MDPAACHRVQGLQGHLALSPQQQELDHRGLGKLRRDAESAVALIVGLSESCHGAFQRRLLDRLRGRPQIRATGQPLTQALAAGVDLLAALAPGFGDRVQHLRPGGHPVAGLGREVRSAVERKLLGREEHVQRPAAAARHRLDGLHVEGVHIGALLAVDLHAHEALVHQLGRARILEGLPLHHVAPVA